MEILRRHPEHKQTVVIAGLLGALLVSFVAVSSSTSYLYRSRADENPQMIKRDQESVVISPIDAQKYACIKSLTYLPSTDQKGCFSQVECVEEVGQASLPGSCQASSGVISCNAPTSICLSSDEWLQQSARICGCL